MWFFVDVLGDVDRLIQIHNPSYVCFGCDLNTDLSRSSPQTMYLKSFILYRPSNDSRVSILCLINTFLVGLIWVLYFFFCSCNYNFSILNSDSLYFCSYLNRNSSACMWSPRYSVKYSAVVWFHKMASKEWTYKSSLVQTKSRVFSTPLVGIEGCWYYWHWDADKFYGIFWKHFALVTEITVQTLSIGQDIQFSIFLVFTVRFEFRGNVTCFVANSKKIAERLM